jgi:hypothetical protein
MQVPVVMANRRGDGAAMYSPMSENSLDDCRVKLCMLGGGSADLDMGEVSSGGIVLAIGDASNGASTGG